MQEPEDFQIRFVDPRVTNPEVDLPAAAAALQELSSVDPDYFREVTQALACAPKSEYRAEVVTY